MKEFTQSQKIRNLYFRLWEKDHEKLTWEEYYLNKTDKIIEFLQKKLNEFPLPIDF